MRKRTILTVLLVIVMTFTFTMLAACIEPVEPGEPGDVKIKREDCDLTFGSEGIKYSGVLAPTGTNPAIGGAVKATVNMIASGANLKLTAKITGIKITLAGGTIENFTDSSVVAGVIVMTFNYEGYELARDERTATLFTFTMPATDDLKYVGAKFSIKVRVTVTHANGESVL